jgi:hypothetical protein
MVKSTHHEALYWVHATVTSFSLLLGIPTALRPSRRIKPRLGNPLQCQIRLFPIEFFRTSVTLRESVELSGTEDLPSKHLFFFSFGATAPIWALAYLHETLRFTSVY